MDPLRRTDPGTDLGRIAPYLGDIAEAVLALDEGSLPRFGLAIDVPLVCAIGLRETWMGWAPGYYPPGDPDGFGDDPDGERGPIPAYGRGLFQVDRRGPFRKHIPPSGRPWPVHDQALAVIDVLRAARAELRAFRGHRLFERACCAAYNAGSPRVAQALRAGLDPDCVTTKGPARNGRPRRPDYGAHVLEVRDALRRGAPARFPSPPQRIA